MTETLMKRSRRYRDVSDLRTQFQCEYRLYLKQKLGTTSTGAAHVGARLHEKVKLSAKRENEQSRLFRVAIAIITIFAALLWMMG
ncbi:MAG: hypothetical protein ACFFAY_11360 [Promethearchaeota archaeon]